MEEILKEVDKLFESAYDVGKKWEEDFEAFKKTINNIALGKKETSSTPQQKKKAKRLSIIVDDEDSETSTHELKVSKVNEVLVKTETIETSMVRPPRMAKSKVASFKEPSLAGKLRRPSNLSETLSMTQIGNTTQTPENSEKESNQIEPTTEKQLSTNNNSSKRSIEEAVIPEDEKNNSVDSAKKVDESLLIVSNGDVPVLEISDGDVDKLMPPPAEIPKKKNTRKGKTSDSPEKASTRSSRLRIKQEKISLDQASASVKDKADERESSKSTEIPEEMKQEKSEDVPNIKQNKGGKKTKKPYKCMPIKEERQSSKKEEEPQKAASNETRQTRNKTKQTSMESVYEDAVTDNGTKSIVPEQQDTTYYVPPKTRSSKELPPDNTFVSAKDTPVAETNATFVSTTDGGGGGILPESNATFVASSCPQQTFVMEKDNASDQTQVISTAKPTSSVDTTFSVNNETFQAPASEKPQQHYEMNVMRSSIMTEEDSAEECLEPPPLPQSLLKANHKKELFNPVKKKVEAFEKHATAMASPAAQRQTRNKAKLKENKDPESLGSKLVTPTLLLKRDLSKLLTPQLHANVTPNNAIPSNIKKYANSTSKLSQMQKTVTKSTSSLSKTPSLSRDNSTEDLKRAGAYGNKLQQIADERKKKREQKQQQAALTREAKEQERLDKVKKTMQEKEEKRRKAQMQQLEMKKQLDDMNRNLKMQEEETQKKFKQMEYEVGETARKERERLDNLKIQKAKDELQHKLLENQRLEQEKKAAKKAKEGLKYDFDQLNSGDSTDEEGKSTSKRPPPPIWSKSSIRQMIIDRQSELPNKVVDSLFSVQPMTPDLREIFPAIDPRYLKRNSSVYWNTPPRYSQLPKY